MIDRAFLARFLSCGDVPEDLRQWVVAIVHERMSPSERREERDRWFRAAAALIAGEPWTRARRLHRIALDLRGSIPAAPDTSTVRGCTAAALLLCPGYRVPAVHTLYRIACMAT
ncbi:MAG: hypothetical protein M3680_14590 [Myxococcota bacterium]|nr:hypothetical protein [Myxococcota bacterium]